MRSCTGAQSALGVVVMMVKLRDRLAARRLFPALPQPGKGEGRAVGSADVAQSLAGRTVSTVRAPAGSGFNKSASDIVRSIHDAQSCGRRTATWRSW
jgi:hypothetical protein